MKATKDIEMEVMGVHNLFWEAYANRDIELRFSLCSEDVTFIGSGLHEKALNKTDYKKINIEGVKQFPDPFQIEFLWTKISMITEVVACVESEVVWIQLINNELSKELLRNTTLLKHDNNKWLVSHVHGSVPDYRLKVGDYMTNEKTIIRNKELERQVFERTQDLNKTLEELEQKNRELEIEASLERVRAVAMSMHKSDDLLSICEVSYKEFKKLGFDNIRNTLIHIQYDEQKYFMDYDFSDLTGGAITKIEYGSHPVVEDYLKQIRIAKDAFYQGVIKEDQLEEWKDFRKNSGQIDDPRLDKATALYYYFFSIGIGDIGISTLKSIDESQIKILKRFRNVFNLSYQRYIDITLAETQAREAKIEVALERVRGRAMAMRSSEDLGATVNVFFKELKNLGFLPRRCGVAIIDEVRRSAYNMITTASNIGDSFEITGDVNLDSHFVLTNMLLNWKVQQDYFLELDTKQMEEYYRILRPQVAVTNFNDVRQYGYYLHFKEGMFYVWMDKELRVNDLQIFRRFTQVIGLTYRRHLDLQKAEAQAREAKIEVALERIRSRATAMHTSDELMDVATILREQMGLLGQPELETCVVDLFDENSDQVLSWYAFRQPELASGKIVTGASSFSWQSSELTREMMMIYHSGQKECTLEVEGAKAIEFLQLLVKASPEIGQYVGESLPDKMCYHITFFSGGALLMVSYQPPSDEAKSLQRRAAFVFDMAYRRYRDLKKAEAQAREAQIEAALERVRSRTMGMQKSEELREVIRVVYEQFIYLKINVDHAGFVVDYTPKGNWHFWIADERDIPSKIKHPYFESVWANQFNEAKEKEADFFTTNLNFEEKNKFYNELLSYVPGLPEASKDFYLSCPGLAATTVLFDNVSLYIENFSGIPYSDEENKILMRFGKVFQQTYTRFLDLQKAEAQAREAKIESALEKVRSRSLAMHKTDELGEVITVVVEKLRELDISVDDGVALITYVEDSKDLVEWMENPGFPSAIKFHLPYFEHPVLIDLWKAKEDGKDFLVTKYTSEENLSFLNHIFKNSDFKHTPQEVKDYCLAADTYGYSIAFQKNTSIFINDYSSKPLSEPEIEILKRFSKVFEQAYIRFLDLQKAEAQAREAEIELSLERVRSKAMAMHSPNDLSETVNVFFKELKTLGIIPIRCGVGQIDEATRTTSLTTTTSSLQGDSFQVIGKVKQTGHPVLDGIFDHWKLQKEYHPVLEGEEIKYYYDVMNAQIGYPEYPEGVTQYGNNFFFKEGFVFAWTVNLLSEEELIIFRRFTSVLSLTYRRYMDLKEAEAQAREAQIEASLERVRSRTMAMQRSDELAETVSVLFKQLLHLGVKSTQLRTCGISTFKENERLGEIWITDITGEIIDDSFIAPYDEAPAYKTIYSKWKSGEKFLELNLKGDAFLEHLNFVKKYSAVPNINLDEIKKLYTEIFINVIYFSQGYLFIISYEALTEFHGIFKRFGALFHQTYTRFLDFKKVEAQAREAQIEAALERVRSKAMAMHSSEDLAITVDTFFSELNNLKVTPHRCGMGIIDEQSKIVAIHATTVTHENEIKKMTGNLKLAGHPVLDSIFDNWKLQKEYHPVLRGNEIIEYYKVMNPQVSFPDFAGDETQYGYYFFFKEGGVFAWTDKELVDGDLQIFRRYTSVLSLTYRRYKDLKEAEAQAREAKIEAAMEKVRARAMAMQKPGQLVEVAQLLRMEMSLLGVEELETSSIYVHDSASGMTECWYAIQDIREQNKKLVTDYMTLSLNDTWVGREMMKFYTSNQKQTSILMQGENRKEWINYCADHSKVLSGYYGDVIPERTYHLVKFSNGFMGSASPGDISEESWALLNRATTVFSLAYTRFLDLQKAEAQTKEAQIELALERVRARTMAMHKSDELAETAAIVFQQLNNLGIEPNRIYITIIKDETGFCEFWFTDEDGKKVSSGFKANLRENESFIKMYAGWKEKKKSLTIDMQGEELQEYFNHLSSLNVPFKGGLSQQRRIQHLAYFSKGFIGVASPDETKPETLQLLERFAAVFNLTYTRFNDLKQAEAQDKIIQAENERKTKELEEARQLQLSMLPKELPQLPHLDIAVYMKPATEVGGDYYDFNICNDGTLTILVCDATGHGMMSGMMVSIMKSIFISNRNNIDLKEFFENTNNSLKEMHLGRLMMASLGVQITSDKVIATNAGMPSLLYFRNKSKKAGEFVSNNLPLGAMRGIKYSLKEIKYEKGDTLLLMSDGFAELKNKNMEQYGYPRIIEEFRSVAQKSSNEIVEHLKISAAQWIKGIEPDDDVTFVVIKVK